MAYYIKSAIWNNMEKKEYTRYGYEIASKNFKSYDDLNYSGISFMITGGSSGIGKETAFYLASKKGTHIHIICHNKTNGEKVREEVKVVLHPDSKFEIHYVDLSEPIEVHRFCKQLYKDRVQINVLINLAGIHCNTYEENSFRIEKSYSVNVLCMYLLTEYLIPLIGITSLAKRRPRVITVTCGEMIPASLDSKSFHFGYKYYGLKAYAEQKRQQVAITDFWSSKYPGVEFASVNPGWVDTPGFQKARPIFYKDHKDELRTPRQGADTVIWAAISEQLFMFPNGTLFLDRKVSKKFIFSDDICHNKNDLSQLQKNLNKILDDMFPAENIGICGEFRPVYATT